MKKKRALRVTFHGGSDPGRRRPTNEDAFAASDEGAFCVLCDGMGGHSSGEVASRMAVEFLGECLRRPKAAKGSQLELLRDWLNAANLAIYERGASEPGVTSGRNMGTTLALLWVVDEFAYVAHVGDSRIYRLRGETIEALTRDHSVTAPDFGPLARSGRKRKYVTRALGTKPEVAPDVIRVDVRPGDRFVICSDGLTDLVDDREIADAIRDRQGELKNVPRALINLANERGGRDNITVVIAAVEAAPEAESAGLADSGVFVAPPPLEPPPPWDSSDLEV